MSSTLQFTPIRIPLIRPRLKLCPITSLRRACVVSVPVPSLLAAPPAPAPGSGARVTPAEDRQQPGQIVGVLGHGALWADLAGNAEHKNKLPRRFQGFAHQPPVQSGCLARGLG